MNPEFLRQGTDGERVILNRGSNQSGMRAHNERLVLSLLRRHGALSKADIARITGLSPQTVSVIMRALEQDGLLARGEKIRGRVGQPSQMMGLAPEGAFFFGLKIGRRSADLVLTDFLGRIVARGRSTYRYPTPEATLRFVTAEVARLLAKLTPAQQARVAGLGIAMPFFLWEWADIIGVEPAKMAAWRDVDIRAEIDALFDFTVLLQNDATSACGAELVFGAGDAPADFLYFYIGYFIGGGVVLNNRLYIGPSGNAGALGPMPVHAKPGQQLVDVASLAGLEALCQEAGHDPALIWGEVSDWPDDPAVVARWIARSAPHVALGIVSSVSLIDFPLVVIDGWMPKAVRARLICAIEDRMAEMNLSGLGMPLLRAGTIGPDARALGAASLPLSHRFMPEV